MDFSEFIAADGRSFCCQNVGGVDYIASRVELTVLLQELLFLGCEGLGTGCYSNSFLASPFL